jgi:hypothetical protein
MQDEDNIYCGIGPVPKKKKLGTMSQCATKKQLRYYGIKKVDPIILKLSLDNENKKNKKTENKLVGEMSALRSRVKRLTSKLDSKKITEDERREIKKEQLEAVKNLNEVVREYNSIQSKINKVDQKVVQLDKYEIKQLKNTFNSTVQEAKEYGTEIIKQAKKLEKQIQKQPEILIEEILGAPSIKEREAEINRLKSKIYNPEFDKLQQEYLKELELERKKIEHKRKKKQTKKSNIYCGIDLPKNHKRGTMSECVKRGEVKYFGVKKVDPRLLKPPKMKELEELITPIKPIEKPKPIPKPIPKKIIGITEISLRENEIEKEIKKIKKTKPYFYLDRKEIDKLAKGFSDLIKEFREYEPNEQMTIKQEYDKRLKDIALGILYEDYKKNEKKTLAAIYEYWGHDRGTERIVNYLIHEKNLDKKIKKETEREEE